MTNMIYKKFSDVNLFNKYQFITLYRSQIIVLQILLLIKNKPNHILKDNQTVMIISRDMKIPPQKIQQLIPVFKQNFLKSNPYIQDQFIRQILQTAEILQPDIYSTVFIAGDKITQYYFLVRGIVALYKDKNRDIGNSCLPQRKGQSTDVEQGRSINKSVALSTRQNIPNQQSEILRDGKVIGQYINNMHTLRQYTSITKIQYTQILKINKQKFDKYFEQFIKDYNQVDKYVKNVLKLSKKLCTFDLFTLKYYRLGANIRLHEQVGVILCGECKVLFNDKSINKKEDNQKSPNKQNNQCANRLKNKQKQNLFPQIKKIRPRNKTKNRPNIKQHPKQIALISQNQWVCAQNIEYEPKPSQNQCQCESKCLCSPQQSQFRYIITSQNLRLITLCVSNIGILPPSKISMLQKIHKDRLERISNINLFNFNYGSNIINMPRINTQANDSLSHHLHHHNNSYENSPLQSSRSRVVKGKLENPTKILQKLDPNLSPHLFLKNYKLGYNNIRYENVQRKERKTMAAISQVQELKRQRTERKLKKCEYYKVKDWSHYVKLSSAGSSEYS